MQAFRQTMAQKRGNHMKRKFLSAILTSAIILSLTGCKNSQQEQTTAAKEISELDETLNISNTNGIYNGTWYFEANNGEEYFYDIVNNKLINRDDEWELYNNEHWLIGDLLCNNDYILDTKTGEIILSETANADGYRLRSDNNSGLILVSKLSDNSFSLGVMNSKLEWVYPLTELSIDGRTANELNETIHLLVGNYAIIYWTNYAYSFKENKIIEIPYTSAYIGSTSDGSKHLYRNNDGTYVFDGSTGNVTEIGDNQDCYVAGDGIVLVNKDDLTVLNLNDYEEMFDLSEYNTYKYCVYSATEDYIAFDEKGNDGNRYTSIVKKDGSRVIDPIESEIKDYMCLYGDYAVSTGSGYIVNCKTGEIKNDLSIEQFDSVSGKLVIESDGCYYLADPSAPEILINPFEIAEN